MAWLEWTDEMKLGVADIDRQHLKIVETMNDLHKALHEKASFEVISSLLDSLSQQLAAHFRYEEALFEETSYHDMGHHKHEHDTMAQNALDLSVWYKESPNKAFNLKTLEFIKNWAVTHVTIVDKKYMEHFKANGIR